jgi:pimeloyl-ACP methyl ester carboxylesterase
VPKVVANGHSFFYQRMGGGESSVVFIHGLVMDNLSSWWYTVATAAARRADSLCYDLRGHGLSDRPPNGYGVADSVGDLIGILDALGIDRPVYIVGNSYGGVVGLAAAHAHPERVAGLILVEAHVAVESLHQREIERLPEGLDLAGLLLDDAVVENWLETVAGRKLSRMAASAKELIFETTLVEDLRQSAPFAEDEMANITCPVLLVYGEKSDIFARGEVLARLLPNAELHVVKDVDHSVLMGATAHVRELVLDWVSPHAELHQPAVVGQRHPN